MGRVIINYLFIMLGLFYYTLKIVGNCLLYVYGIMEIGTNH